MDLRLVIYTFKLDEMMEPVRKNVEEDNVVSDFNTKSPMCGSSIENSLGQEVIE